MFEAALDLADLNSRMKDFYDIWVLSQTHSFEGQMLQEVVTASRVNHESLQKIKRGAEV